MSRFAATLPCQQTIDQTVPLSAASQTHLLAQEYMGCRTTDVISQVLSKLDIIVTGSSNVGVSAAVFAKQVGAKSVVRVDKRLESRAGGGQLVPYSSGR